MRNSDGERIPLLTQSKNQDGSGMLNNLIIYAENNTQSHRGESYQIAHRTVCELDHSKFCVKVREERASADVCFCNFENV